MTNWQNRRVVVTGLGSVTPIGNNLQEYWTSLLSGRHGFDKITLFDASQHSCQFAAEVKGFNPHDYLEKKEAKRIDRFSQFAIAASKQALKDAEFVIDDLNADRVGVLLGTGVGGIRVMETQNEVLLTKGPRKVSPFTIPTMIANMAAGLTAIGKTTAPKAPLLGLNKLRYFHNPLTKPVYHLFLCTNNSLNFAGAIVCTAADAAFPIL